MGEIRRYYRDRAWAVHVPRSVQELRVRVNATIDQWSAEHGEAPTTAELAEFLDVSPDAVPVYIEYAPLRSQCHR